MLEATSCDLTPNFARPKYVPWLRSSPASSATVGVDTDRNPTLACCDPPLTDFPEITANWFQSHLDFSGACHSLGPKPSRLEKPSLGEEGIWFSVCHSGRRPLPGMSAGALGSGTDAASDLFRVLRAELDRAPLPGPDSLTLPESQW